MFTVKQLSKLAGVTPRTLRYYDAIGLLKPARVGENGYRYYGRDSALRLQQILFYRELDLPLEDIRRILGERDFDLLSALESHKQMLGKRAARLRRLIQTVDETIRHLKGETSMSNTDFFAGFSEEKQEEYARQAEEMYDPETVRASNRRWKAYPAEKKQAILDEGRQIYLDGRVHARGGDGLCREPKRKRINSCFGAQTRAAPPARPATFCRRVFPSARKEKKASAWEALIFKSFWVWSRIYGGNKTILVARITIVHLSVLLAHKA